jgi:hypothetical protein
LLDALRDFKLASAATTKAKLDEVSEELTANIERLPTTDKPVLEIMKCLVVGFAQLCEWANRSINGEDNAMQFLTASHAQAIVAAENLSSTRHEIFATAARDVINELQGIDSLDQIKLLADKVMTLSVPILVLQDSSQQPIALKAESRVSRDTDEPSVIKMVFEFEHRPWRTPQLLRANTIYDFSAQVTIPCFPGNSDHLKIDYVSTLAPQDYHVTPLKIYRPSTNNVTEFNVQGHAEFRTAQSILSAPINILVRAIFLSSTDESIRVPATIVGYRHLPVKVSDPSRTWLLSKYPSIDARIAEVVEEITDACPNLDSQHLDDFINLLAAVTNHMGRNLQRPIYQQGSLIKEPEFQTRILEDLRMQLGEDVQEAPRQGGGPLDIRYRSITLELKVENTTKNRDRIVKKFTAQPTQYSSASGSQLGIIAVLDQTSKDEPPASPQNNIIVTTPTLHGFQESAPPYPTKMIFVIVDGNLRSPSDYSK